MEQNSQPPMNPAAEKVKTGRDHLTSPYSCPVFLIQSSGSICQPALEKSSTLVMATLEAYEMYMIYPPRHTPQEEVWGNLEIHGSGSYTQGNLGSQVPKVWPRKCGSPEFKEDDQILFCKATPCCQHWGGSHFPSFKDIVKRNRFYLEMTTEVCLGILSSFMMELNSYNCPLPVPKEGVQSILLVPRAKWGESWLDLHQLTVLVAEIVDPGRERISGANSLGLQSDFPLFSLS